MNKAHWLIPTEPIKEGNSESYRFADLYNNNSNSL
jgi:hypothetical protein